MPSADKTGRKTAQGQAAQRRKASGGKASTARGSQPRAQAGPPPQSQSGETHLQLHTVHADLPIPYFTPRDITANAHVVTSHLPAPSAMPPPRTLAFYGGLGALALAGAVDWPVALAIGAATVVARGKGEKERQR
jgi:hypothetical protein